MNVITRNPAGIPAVVLKAYGALRRDFSEWGPVVTITQEQVDCFTALTGDGNPIHKAGNPQMSMPIVPGLLELALLPRLLPGGLPLEVPGHIILNRKVECEFKRPVTVGTGICMRYRPHGELVLERVGVSAHFEFEIGFASTKKATANGLIDLFVMPG